MSVKKTVALDNAQVVKSNVTSKRRRFNQCFSFMEISMEPAPSLSHLDSNKFKSEIKRWAKAVVAYARQVSGRFGSSRRSDPYGSSRSSADVHS
ncbi:hypothetical protein QQP08_020032 [Theobroma cacao]|nr:hypothetical protein QQP08_020032 [Theobroma cacao]